MHLIPQRCAHRPLAGGLVVPWVSLVHNDHPAFGSLHAERARTAFLGQLCQICGQPLEERCFLIMRPADAVRRQSPEPALHPECLPYTAAHCPMLNGAATHYRRSPVLASHPAGRPCTDPSCPCPSLSPEERDAARRGRPADRFEAWMIHTRRYRLVFAPTPPGLPTGISVDVPILRRRLLRAANLAPAQQQLLDLWHALMTGP